MKSLNVKATSLLLVVALFITIGCTTDQIVDVPTESTIEKTTTPNLLRQKSKVNPPTYSNFQLVIKYAPHVKKESEKEQVRQEHGVIAFKKCNCNDDSIELWQFSEDEDIDILDRAEAADYDDEVEKSGLNYDVFITDPISSNNPQPDPNTLQKLIKGKNTGVTIAVLDTGLDYTNPIFEKEFLYNHYTPYGCKEQTLYGNWDYTNNTDADLLDLNGHGTEITSMIYQSLLESNTEFQILPIKAFDKYGSTDSFTITCGLMYAKDHGADIINTSFGYYDTNIEFIQDEVLTVERDILYVVASGNDGIDIDRERRHYPSSIVSSNIVSVTGVDADFENLWEYSNYGSVSVDVAAQSEGINSIIGESILSGTSYAVPKVVVRAARLFNESQDVQGLKDSVIASGIFVETLEGKILHPIVINND